MAQRAKTAPRPEMHLGRFTRAAIEDVLRAASAMRDLSAKIDFISSRFLGVPYGSSTLSGSADGTEALVIDLRAVDCFTYLDYVESMRLSRSLGEFRRRLAEVRYRSAVVSYGTRNHFFTDWAETSRVEDVTATAGRERAETVRKTLNVRADGSHLLAGVPAVEREIVFIPAACIDEGVRAFLRTGDYLGIHTEQEGLDVSHVGIAVRRGGALLLRHASSVEKKVIDQDLDLYMQAKPGLLVLRPRQ